jgi:hypothetical protein
MKLCRGNQIADAAIPTAISVDRAGGLYEDRLTARQKVDGLFWEREAFQLQRA